jgi:hypothetical protein
LLGQFDILHRNGDAHAGNSGLVAREDSSFFVIGDPTMLAISPLSWLSDVAADGVPGRILEILRRRARGGSLYRDMSDMDTDEAPWAVASRSKGTCALRSTSSSRQKRRAT